MGKSPGKGFHISRINDSGNYEPGNCVWKKGIDNIRERKYENGADRYNAKLTDDIVREMRALKKEGMSDAKLAAKYGVDRKTIWSVVKYKTWVHVAD